MTKAIYVITNKVNGKQYVGQSVHPEIRWWQHRNNAKIKYDNLPIHLAISKYGEDNFDFEILEWTDDYDNREKQIINELNTISPNGYNVSSGGNSNVMIGEDNPRNTLSNKVVLNIIKDLKESQLSDRDIARKYNSTDKIIADINHGYTHKQNDIIYPIRRKIGLQKLSMEQVNEIIEHLKNTTISYQELADKYKVSKGAIYHINKGLTFHDDSRVYPIR